MAKPLGITLPLRLGANGYFANTTDVMVQVRSNLMNLLLTQRGERPFQPDFGCDLPVGIFDAPSDDGLAEAQSAIQTAVQQWMPFVRVDSVKVVKVDGESTVSVAFTLLTNNVSDSISLVF